MTEQLKPYFSNYFQCDNCQKEFRRDTTYSPNSSLKLTYCFECVEDEVGFCSFQNKDSQVKCPNPLFNKKKQLCRQHYYQLWKKFNQIKKQSLEKSLKKLQKKVSQLDKRITGRTKQLNLKVREQTYWRLKELALKNGCLLTEVIERLLEKHGKVKGRKKAYLN